MIEYTVKVFPDAKWWYLDGLLHREDGPAVECANGDKEWWLNGKRHREDGPAVEWSSGYEEWHLNGKLHREDGPAVEWSDGDKEWWLNGEEVTEEEVMNPVEEMTMDQICKALSKQVKVVK